MRTLAWLSVFALLISAGCSSDSGIETTEEGAVGTSANSTDDANTGDDGGVE